jgi:tetratricopeptide (TPR) repeat protein
VGRDLGSVASRSLLRIRIGCAFNIECETRAGPDSIAQINGVENFALTGNCLLPRLSSIPGAGSLATMDSIEPPDTHHLSAAVGWLELGNESEALSELSKISPERQNNPEVLEVNWLINASKQNWPAALAAARHLVENDPTRSAGWLHRAYALRRVPEGGLQAAWDALFPAAERFPNEPTIPYNLACYACQMDQMETAREWLRKAIQVGNKAKIKMMALSDSDLKPLWNEVKDW